MIAKGLKAVECQYHIGLILNDQIVQPYMIYRVKADDTVETRSLNGDAGKGTL